MTYHNLNTNKLKRPNFLPIFFYFQKYYSIFTKYIFNNLLQNLDLLQNIISMYQTQKDKPRTRSFANTRTPEQKKSEKFGFTP